MKFRSIRWATKSLWHHILFVILFASLPTSILFVAFAYQDQDLTLARVIQIASIWTLAGLALAVAGWYVILPPIRHRSRRRKDGDGD